MLYSRSNAGTQRSSNLSNIKGERFFLEAYRDKEAAGPLLPGPFRRERALKNIITSPFVNAELRGNE
jgi:hypothetical protein